MNPEQLIYDMIKENPNATIKDYLELRGELEAIHKSTVKAKKERFYKLLKQIDQTLNK